MMEVNRFGYWANVEEYPNARKPDKVHVYDVGFDLFLAFAKDYGLPFLEIEPKQRQIAHTGIHLKLYPGWEAQIRPRSGNAAKLGLTVLNTPGTIDPEYVGELMVILYNSSDTPVKLQEGDRIAQMVIKRVPLVELTQLNEKPQNDSRGESGLGSSGN